MDSCNAVEKEVDKVISKFIGISDHSEQTLSDLADHIQTIKSNLDSSPDGHILTPEQIQILYDTISKVKEATQSIATDHRDLHSTVSKVGKAIDRNFVMDVASTSRENVIVGPAKEKLLYEVIRQHFYREGYFDVAEKFCGEAAVQPELLLDDYIELHQLLDCLQRKELGPPMEWVLSHRKRLAFYDSELEFKMHKLYYLVLLDGGEKNQMEALTYARQYFPEFADKHVDEIPALMGMLAFLPQGLATSPYKDYYNETLWTEICDVFQRDACRVMGIETESALAVCINAGCTALPALHNIKQVMAQRHVAGVNDSDNRPVEIDLGLASKFHSIFACPILKQQSSDNNPPMRLVCGHVISQDALLKLTNGNNKLKCPYCPLEQNPNDARPVYF